MRALDPWCLENLVCPVDRSALRLEGQSLVTEAGRRYPVVDGLPVMLIDAIDQTIGVARASLDRALGREGATDLRAPDYHLESLGVSEPEKQRLLELIRSGQADIDPVALMLIGATSGYAYKHLIGNTGLTAYPIPQIKLPDGGDKSLLDIGCNWGRWSIAASQQGYRVTGLDPSLGAVLAARRIAESLGLGIRHVVGDGRHLPFKPASFATVYSYSVLQHFSKADAKLSLTEMGRVLDSGGVAKIQMANAFGARSIQHQARRRFREPKDFDVRYWSVPELRRAFTKAIGSTSVATDCYFGLGWQWSDLPYMPKRLKPVLAASECLRRTSNWLPPLRYVADSVFCTAVKSA